MCFSCAGSLGLPEVFCALNLFARGSIEARVRRCFDVFAHGTRAPHYACAC
jgi:hypothetical protein